MWKLWNKLFGWDYIAWSNSADNGVARVYKGYSQKPWYFRYKITNVVDRINSADQVFWLTCEPSKYLGEE